MSDTIFITGGLGFIGRHLIKKLLKDTEATILTLTRSKQETNEPEFPHSRVINYVGDVQDMELVQNIVKQSTKIIHLAAVHSPKTLIQEMLSTNIIGTANILEACVLYPIEKLIFLSSAGVYKDAIIPHPLDEESQLQPINPYAISKLAAEHLINYYYLLHKVPSVILRLFNIYGPNQQPNQMIPLFISNLLANKQIILNHGGVQERDWIYVDDVVTAITTVLSSQNSKIIGEAYNIGTGHSISVSQVANSIIKLLHTEESLLIKTNNSPQEINNSISDCTKIYNDLGWRSTTSFEDGIRKTIDVYKN